jgi:tripeptide aminopeptidase
VLAVRERLGLPLALGQGSSDANAALAVGIPALCLGVARGSGMHSLQERISRPSLSEGARLLECVLRALLRAEGAGG